MHTWGNPMPTRAGLAKIHIAKRELHLTDELYRDLMYVFFKKKSARDLNKEEVDELILHFKSLGWSQFKNMSGLSVISDKSLGAHLYGKKYDDLGNRKDMASPAQLRLIEALWMMGPGVRLKTREALRHFLQHYFHVSDLRFIKSRQVTSILGAVRRIGHPAHHKN